jgi:hypothetical protein
MNARFLVAAALFASIGTGCYQVAKMMARGDSQSLRTEPSEEKREHATRRASLLVLAIDGVERDFFYEMLRGHRLKGFSKLLADDGRYSHAYFDQN